LTGTDDDAAQAYLRGFNLGWRSVGVGVPLVYDSEGDPVRAVRLAQKLAAETHAWGVVGGLTTAEAAALAATAECVNVPFLTTSCGAADLSAIGRNTFQGRADFHRIGRELGRYAILELELAHFAILAPRSDEGRQIARGFKESVELAGCEIIAEEAYYQGANDYSASFARIRATGLRRAYDDSLRGFWKSHGYILIDDTPYHPPQSAIIPEPLPPGLELEPEEEPTFTLSKALLDSLWEADIARQRRWIVNTKQEIDSLEIPLSVYDGFLMVIEPGAIPIAAAQFARFNFQTKLFGDENWGDREALARVQSYVDGLIYPEPLTVTGSEDYQHFSAEIAQSDGGPVNKQHLAGERAARMIAFAAAHADGPASLRLTLSQIRDLPTLSGTVSLLKEERVDRRVNLMQFIGGQFVTLTK
jgi:ABC-type branched-subunit amino acid transport system substrate-binding protein